MHLVGLSGFGELQTRESCFQKAQDSKMLTFGFCDKMGGSKPYKSYLVQRGPEPGFEHQPSDLGQNGRAWS